MPVEGKNCRQIFLWDYQTDIYTYAGILFTLESSVLSEDAVLFQKHQKCVLQLCIALLLTLSASKRSFECNSLTAIAGGRMEGKMEMRTIKTSSHFPKIGTEMVNISLIIQTGYSRHKSPFCGAEF